MAQPHPHTRMFRAWITILLGVMAAAAWCYWRQLESGLGLTGMSRDVSWGLYIGQFTVADGLAASAAMLILPYYFHNSQAFGRVALYGQFVAIAGVMASMLFIVADMGRPSLVLNVMRYASPHSLMFWDMVSLNGYLVLNAVVAGVTLICERKDVPPPRWLRTVILVSVPWAIGMQTVSALLYCGLPGRWYWLTAILAPRFIVSSFASGPALLILLLLVLRRVAGVEVRAETLVKLRQLVRYALALNVFFLLLEGFTTFYSGIPEPIEHFYAAAPWLWTSAALAIAALAMLQREKLLAAACVTTFAALWIDKGLGMIIGGFVPSPLGAVTPYVPTLPEIVIAAGIWAVAALAATMLFRIRVAAKPEADAFSELTLLEEVPH